MPEEEIEPLGRPDWVPSPPAPAAEVAPSGPRRRTRTVLALALAGLLLLGGGIGIGWGLTRGHAPPSATSGYPITTAPPSNPSSGSAEQGIDSTAVARKVVPSVVDVNTVLANPLGEGGEGAGTGVLITSSGEVLTNNHVIQGATRIDVTIAGSFGAHQAKVLGADPSDDIALLQVQGVSGLPAATIGDSSDLQVGQEVVAIGNALGRGRSPAVTQGTISALARSITVSDGRGGTERLKGLIQTNASIQPGDSGGPIVNSAGQIVGMITAGSRSGFGLQTPSAGFAIPSNAALDIANEIRAGRSSPSIIIGPSGFLGVVVRELDGRTAARLGLNVTSGVLVLAVNPGSPAAGAGIAPNSVITAIDGHRIASVDALGSAIHRHKPGEQIGVTWVDRAGTHSATVSLVAGPAV